MPKQERNAIRTKKLKSMSPMSAEATVARNYLDWMMNFHGQITKINTDLNNAKKF